MKIQWEKEPDPDAWTPSILKRTSLAGYELLVEVAETGPLKEHTKRWVSVYTDVEGIEDTLPIFSFKVGKGRVDSLVVELERFWLFARADGDEVPYANYPGDDE